MTYQAIIFDFNGTLFWDMDLHKGLWQKRVLEYRENPLTDEEWELKFVGRANGEIWPWILGFHPTDEEVAELSEEKEQAYRDLLVEQPHRVKLVDGAVELFETCLANGIAIAIGTAAGQSNVEFYREAFDLHRWFRPEHIVYDDGTMPGKPDPALFATAMTRLHVAPEKCIVVEDGTLGFQAARSAGAGKVYGIWSDEPGRKRLDSIDLDRRIHTYREMDLGDFQAAPVSKK